MPHTLLLADDSITIQRVIELTFADEDIKVVAVSDGDQAISALDRHPPDIVLADLGMPGRNGYQVAEHIKRSPHLAHIPVLLLTGAFEPVDQNRAAAVGCDGVLAKPFEPQLVISRVRELLARPKSVAGHERAAPAAPAAQVAEPPQAGPAPAVGDHPWFAPAPNAVTPPLDTPPSDPAAAAAAKSDLDEYFERLDRAFANLSAGAPPETASAPSPAPTDWFVQSDESPLPAAEPAPPLSFASPQSDFERVAEQPQTHAEAAEQPQAYAEAAAPERPYAYPPAAAPEIDETRPEPSSARYVEAEPRPLSDAFAALLAAERHLPAPWPDSAWQISPSAAEDALMERVAQRVIAQLSERAVRDSVAEMFSSVAERLVRDEIERIKASIP